MQWCTLRLETSLICTVRGAVSLKLPLSLPGRTLTLYLETLLPLFRMHHCECSDFYCDASGQSVSPLSESSPSLCKH